MSRRFLNGSFKFFFLKKLPYDLFDTSRTPHSLPTERVSYCDLGDKKLNGLSQLLWYRRFDLLNALW